MEVEENNTVLSVRMSPETLEDFRLACMLRDTTMSKVINAYVEEIIITEYTKNPKAFKRRDFRPGEWVN